MLKTYLRLRKMHIHWQIKNLTQKVIYISLSLLVIAIPAVSTYLLIHFLLGEHLLKFIPQWSDEIFYWREVATFKSASFNGGFYTLNEQPAAISFIHFYAWGPLYPILFGSLAKLIGWEYYFGPLINIILFTLAIAWFIPNAKPNLPQLLLLGVVLLSFWPAHLYMVTNLREVMFYSFSLVVSVFFIKTINNPDSVTRMYIILFGLTITLLTLFKVNWTILYFPYLLLIRKRLRLTVLQSITLFLIISVVSFFIFHWTRAPIYLGNTSQLLAHFQNSLYAGLMYMILHLWNQVRSIFVALEPLWFMLRAQVLLAALYSGFQLWNRKKDEATVRESVVILSTIILSIMAAFIFYDFISWHDFRLFAPILLMVMVIFLIRKRYGIVSLLLMISLVLTPNFIKTYRTLISDKFEGNRMAIEKFSSEITAFVAYDKTQDGWTNTLLAPGSIAFNPVILGVPPGIGISWFMNPGELGSVKSRYLLLDQNSFEVLKDHVCLDGKVATDIGVLYTNQGEDCIK